jgi:non-specific serine/threonine protein kinase
VLTSREEEVAELASTGLAHREIAERMSVSKRTVDAHLEHIYAKLGVSSWQELAVWLAEREQS